MKNSVSLSRSMLALTIAFLLSIGSVLPAVAMQTDESDEETSASEEPTPDVGPRFAIYPADGVDGDFFTLEAEPGSEHELTVLLGNGGHETIALRTYVNDVVPVTNGGFALAMEDQEPAGTAAWIDYPADSLEIEPEEGIERTFTVTVPEDAAVGQHIAGLALETVDAQPVEGTELLEQVIRKTIAVFIIVPGEEEPAFSLGAPEYSTAGALDTIEVPVENTGNVLVRPAGEVTVTDADGLTVVTAPIAMQSVYAGMSVALSVPVGVPLTAGDYTVSVELEDEETGTSASIDEATVTVSAEEEAAAQFVVTATVDLMPDADDPAYADVNVAISNDGAPVATAEVLLDVILDGELVETFPLAASVPLPQGESAVAQRYIPPTGWEAGTWSFVVHVNAIDPASGTSSSIAVIDDIPEFEVGG